MLTLRMPWTNQTLDKHVGDSTDSDNEEKEDGELEEGEVEEEFDEIPQQKDDAKENNRDNNSTTNASIEQDNSMEINNHLNMGSQKFRRRDYHHHHLGPPRLNSSGGQQDKRNKHDQRRKRRHSGEERDDRNRKLYKRGRFRGGPMPDLPEDGDDDDMMGPTWPPRGQNRGQRKQQSDILSNENSESIESGDPQSSSNPTVESKSEQSINSDETSSPVHDLNDDENLNNTDEKQDRLNRSRTTRNNQQQNSMALENRGRRYYDGNLNNNNPNNRRPNDRDRSSWQDRNSNNNNNNGNNTNTNISNNPRFRSDTGSSTNHGPPLCKFFVENRCIKGNDCSFSHDYKPTKKMEICKYYVQNKGYCQKNESCPYLHGEFPCKFFHTGTKDCMQGDRCKFSHDPITNEDIRHAFDRFLADTDDMNRQNRGNSNSNMYHSNNSSSVNFDVIGAAPLPPPPPLPGALTDPANFSMIPNLMDLFLLQNGRLPNPTVNDSSNTENLTTNPSQSSPPVQRPSLFNDTLSTEKTDNEESNVNKTVSSTNNTSPSSSTQNTTSTNDSASTTTVTTANTTPSMTTTTTSSTCPLPLPPANANINLPSPFGRLPPSNLTRPQSSLLPPPPPHGLFPLNTLGTGRVPILFSNNNGLPLPPPPPPTGSLLDMKLLAQAAALAAVNAAVATKFSTTSHHHSQSSSPQLGRDIDERDRQSSSTMRGDIDERPSDAYNRPTTTITTTNLGLLQTATPPQQQQPTNLSSPTSSSSPTMTTTINDEHLKNKSIQDIFRSVRPTSVDTLSNSTTSNSTAGPSFDFISMLEQLKQPKQIQINDNAHDSLEIRSSSTPAFVYILRPVLVSFKPYILPDKSTDPRIIKYQEKMSQWSEQARSERVKTTIPSSNMFPAPLRTHYQQQQQTMLHDTSSSRDPRLLRNSVPSSKISVPLLPTPTPFARPNDNIL